MQQRQPQQLEGQQAQQWRQVQVLVVVLRGCIRSGSSNSDIAGQLQKGRFRVFAG
jgi:hypothetical protein